MKLLIPFLLLPAVTLADPQPWMKKENPNELMRYSTTSDSCPLTNTEVGLLINNGMVRARVKPVLVPDLVLNVVVLCTEDQRDANFFHVSVLIDFMKLEKPFGWIRIGNVPHSTYSLTADRDYLETNLRNYVDDALADYLKANFDLGEDD